MKTLATNKKAFYNYEILETNEAGIVLSGPEVKASRQGLVNLAGSYISLDKNNEVWLNNASIAPYPPAQSFQERSGYDPLRNRKLLLSKKEINSLIGKIKIKGLTLIPLKIYLKNNLIKAEIGLARGKKKWEKKEKIKEREMEKRIKREFQL